MPRNFSEKPRQAKGIAGSQSKSLVGFECGVWRIVCENKEK